MKHTKIVATISDQRCDVDFLKQIINEGVNVVRLNTAHMGVDGFRRVIANVRSVSTKIGILMDTKGPEVRTTPSDAPIFLKSGSYIKLGCNVEEKTNSNIINVNYAGLYEDLSIGAVILIDDGEIQLEIKERNDNSREFTCLIKNDSTLGSRKSVNVPGLRLNLPSLTQKDKNNILYAIENGVDFIAHSFVRNRQDVQDIQNILDEHNSQIKIIAKIENQEGVDNIDDILEVAYGVMVARGDLGIEVPYEKIPAIQSMLIHKCIERKKPVIVATQMLHTMIQNPLPTRAEVTDIANAIYFRTDAVMLSGETAYGKYPVEAVKTMNKIILEAEKSHLENTTNWVNITGEDVSTTGFLAKQAVKSVSDLGVTAIVTDSYTGRTACSLAAFRGTVPVYAVCYEEELTRILSLSYGVYSEYKPIFDLKNGVKKVDFKQALQHLVDNGLLHLDDRIAHMSGLLGAMGSTTSLEINTVNNILTNFD